MCLEVNNDHQKSSRLKSLVARSQYWAVFRFFALQVFQHSSKKFGTAGQARKIFFFDLLGGPAECFPGKF